MPGAIEEVPAARIAGTLLRRHVAVDQLFTGGLVGQHDHRFGVAEAHAADFADFDRVF